MTTKNIRTAFAAVAFTSLLALTGCAATGAASPTSSGTAASEEHDHEHDHDHEGGEATEAAGPTPRVVVTYDGGLMVLDSATLEVVADYELDGFNRVNAAGDGRHVLVSTTGGWALLDTGTWTEPHGDHTHSYTAEPALYDVVVDAEAPGHVVVHDGLTTLFDDGTGEVTVIPTADWTEIAETGTVEPVRTYTTENPHHGVAMASQDDTLFVTEGNETDRDGASLLNGADEKIVTNDQCPGVHGETVVGESILVGCEDGVLLLHGDHFHKIDAEGEFARIGNAHAVEGSAIVLGDYKTDPDAGNGLQQISLIDTDAEAISVVEVGSTYTWRGLDRGLDGSALVLGEDGGLRVIDAESGEITSTIEVISSWTAPVEWQEAHPAIAQERGYVYVTEPATSEIHKVDYVSGEVVDSAVLPHATNELVVVTG
ncbi:hypothetical protein [Gulosibacter chungangensis]|uniref:PQQ-binding-like beta-propeller repeat protein n=1 Tax=Gulosibacter chungangensis TaxID=979746 RepID=A0A7J5BBE8_9MICO|nr:hypothetical protein [Gulosibacter chungangensis]KAB1643470.1 hypothetical protein F8O05_06170 [Gulosibacter chungangensis]